MYEKIFEIIEHHLFKTKISIAGKDVLANEIDILTHEHYIEFAEWFKIMNEISEQNNYSKPKMYVWVNEDSHHTMDMSILTIDEVYLYWLNNIKDENIL